MAGLASIIAVLSLPIVVLLPEPSSAAYVLNVRLYTYRNSNHRDSSGDCCDYFIFQPRRCKNDCDNIFTFCLRGANDRTGCPLGSNRFRNFRDSIDFPSHDSSIRSFSSRESWPGSALLNVRIVDRDRVTRNDLVDNIDIPIHLNPGQSTPRRTYRGVYGRSRFELSFELRCLPNFYGENCLTNCVPTDNEGGHFGCGPRGERLCLNGWKDPGNHCLTPICEDCNPIGGDCTAPEQCICQPGWSGVQCKQCIEISTGCSMEGGYCDIPGECHCLEGYRGDNCEVYLFPCDREPEPCKNGATCINDGRGGYTCNCSSGYGGRNCTIPCDMPNVTSCEIGCNNSTNPCENGGTCLTDFGGVANRSSCVCRQGFSGEYCEINVDDCRPNPCRNGGTCQHDNSTLTNVTCTCAEGYTGVHCEVDIDYCNLTQPCQNNGTCIELEGTHYMCSCPDGWAGQNCSVERDECMEFQPCKNGANCKDLFDDYECDCVPGYMGRDCEQEIDECSPVNPCINGNCTDRLNNYTCQCFDEFTGRNCETDLNSCRSAPCRNGGTCTNEPDGFYVCTCPPGYTSFDCEATDNCLSSPCNNQGTCVDEEGGYYCICEPGVTGINCSMLLNPEVSPLSQNQDGRGEAIVGGVIGGVVFLLLLLTVVVIAIYLVQKKKSNKYKAMSAIVYSVNGDGEGYDNPNYVSDIQIQEPGRGRQLSQSAQSNHTYSSLGNSLTTPLMAGAQEDDQSGGEYHNFDNPLYTESQTLAESPTYNRTELPGPRGPTITSRSEVGNGRFSTQFPDSAVPRPMEYAYVEVSQQEGADGNGSVQQEDGIYELLNKED